MPLDPSSQLARAKNKLRRAAALMARPRDRQKTIVSMTSYPARIGYAEMVVRSLFAQSELADLIVLYLSLDQFPEREADLPAGLLACRGMDFQIRWVEGDMRSHKKYLYAVRDFPNDLIITVDDDILCRNTLVAELLEGHRKFPDAVVAIRAHVIRVGKDGRILPYGDWAMEIGIRHPEAVGVPSMAAFATTGAGTLFAPGSLPEAAFDEDAIRATCMTADDIWLKAMTAIAGRKTVAVPGWMGADCIEGSQETSLWADNAQGGNNRALDLVREHCEKNLGVVSLDALLADPAMERLVED